MRKNELIQFKMLKDELVFFISFVCKDVACDFRVVNDKGKLLLCRCLSEEEFDELEGSLYSYADGIVEKEVLNKKRVSVKIEVVYDDEKMLQEIIRREGELMLLISELRDGKVKSGQVWSGDIRLGYSVNVSYWP